MWIKFLKPILFFIPLVIAQLVIIPMISVENIAPDIIFVMIVYFAVRDGQIFGMLVGFVLGFLFDLIAGGLLGANMFAFTVSAFIAGYFHNENKMDINLSTYFFLLILFISSLVCSFIYAAIASSNSNLNIVFLFIEGGLLPAVYTTLFGIPVVVFRAKKGIA